MANTFELEIVTPERRVVSEPAEELQIPGRSGYLGILPGHAPLLTELAVGEMTYRNAQGLHRFAIAWGFAEVLPDKVTILAETAERSTEIDVARAQQDKARAEEELKAAHGDVHQATAAADALQRAQNRLEVAGRNG
jgi:F-type H+-transporting ATPase subunit epsilon